MESQRKRANLQSRLSDNNEEEIENYVNLDKEILRTRCKIDGVKFDIQIKV